MTNQLQLVIIIMYRLDRPGIEPRWGPGFPPSQTGPGVHPTSCTMGTGSFPGVKYGQGVLLTTHLLLVPRSWKSRVIPLPTLWAKTGPVTGTFYLHIRILIIRVYLRLSLNTIITTIFFVYKVRQVQIVNHFFGLSSCALFLVIIKSTSRYRVTRTCLVKGEMFRSTVVY